MPTNDERREIARRMRAFSERFGCISILHLACAIGAEKSDAESLYGRLADLIEPDAIPDKPDKTGRPLSEPEIDRERLLAIATMMAADSVRSVKKGISVSPVYILHAARDIAEACGETFGSIRNRDLAEWGTSIVPKELVVDRDALLALADDIDKQTDGSMFDAWLEDGHYIARRIREAVGA